MADAGPEDDHPEWSRLIAAAQDGDGVQDVLLSVHAVRHTYDPDRAFLPWLMAIHRHRLADWQRRSLRRAANEVAVDSLEETFAGAAANMDEEPAFGRNDVRAAVAGLPPAQRKALELLKLKDMSLKEAARHSGMSETALKVATRGLAVRLRGAVRHALRRVGAAAPRLARRRRRLKT